MKQLVFPCGATHPFPDLPEYPTTALHILKDGSIDFLVGAPRTLSPLLANGQRAPCADWCVKPGRHAKEHLVYFGDSPELQTITTCAARIVEDGIDVTPTPTGPCRHCEVQRAYATACRRAAKNRLPMPDRREFGRQMEQ
jgi:hypothetical protein